MEKHCSAEHPIIWDRDFGKAFGISFLGRDEKKHIPWQNSWGLSTRLIGAVVMTHSDNKGLVLPPNAAYNKIVIIPIFKGEEKEDILKECKKIETSLKQFNPILDDRDEYTPGWKYNEYELKGIPIRIEFGPKDLEKKQVILVRRDNGKKEPVKVADLKDKIKETLEQMHEDMFKKAGKFMQDSIAEAKNWNEFLKAIKTKKLVKTTFCGEAECEDWIKDKTGGASSRLIPFDEEVKKGDKCVHCNKEARYVVYFSKSY